MWSTNIASNKRAINRFPVARMKKVAFTQALPLKWNRARNATIGKYATRNRITSMAVARIVSGMILLRRRGCRYRWLAKYQIPFRG